jgi:hypothetical protein
MRHNPLLCRCLDNRAGFAGSSQCPAPFYTPPIHGLSSISTRAIGVNAIGYGAAIFSILVSITCMWALDVCHLAQILQKYMKISRHQLLTDRIFIVRQLFG